MKMQYKVCKSSRGNVVKATKATKHELAGGHQCTVVHIELVTSWPVTFLWILLSWLVSTLATTAYVHPEWFVREGESSRTEVLSYDRTGLVSTLGMVSVCYRGKRGDSSSSEDGGEELECHNFGEDFPSGAWQTAYVLFGSGCVLLTWCSILAFCNIWIVGKRNRQLVAVMVGRIQLVAVLLQSASLLLYPLVLGSPLAKAHCGPKAASYSWASCRLGWAYVAAIASTVLAGYCPLLAYFSHHNRFRPCLWNEI